MSAPPKVLVIPGLTLPTIEEADRRAISTAAGPGSTVHIVDDVVAAIDVAREEPDISILLGLMPRRLFDALGSLAWVHAIASGVDSYLYPAMRDSAVLLTSEKGLVGEHLADHAFGLLLALTRRIGAAVRFGADGWNRRPELRFAQRELTGSTMGIVGFGGTGRAIARRARAFGMEVIAVDRDPVEPNTEVSGIGGLGELDDLLTRSDVVAIGCPLTEETRGMFDEAAFALMKDSALLINVTRGEIMDDDALVDALRSGQIAGAGLDVTPIEPLPPEHPLWSIPNVVLTPHTAGASPLRAGRNLQRFCDNLVRFRSGEPLEGIVDKTLGY